MWYNHIHDAAGNVTEAPESCFQYDTNNRLVIFNENTVTYDLDGNMLLNGAIACTYDSANRLISAGGHTYTYNAEDVRIRNLCSDADTTYTYDVNCKLNRLLSKTTNGNTTKYVYGRGLIGEEKCNAFKTYHFDARGSTIALTNEDGNITDTLHYDTYGKLTSHVGESFIIFGYNGRDGVITDKNGLIYMRARYYSPEMKRFVNADIVAGEISNAITLNRFAYANGNPVSFVDPFGLSVALTVLAVSAVLGLCLSLGGDSKQEEAASSQPMQQEEKKPRIQSPAPEITSVEQARALYMTGQIRLEDIPPPYNWDPSGRAQYKEKPKQRILEQKKSVQQIQKEALDITGYATDVLGTVGEETSKYYIRNSPTFKNIPFPQIADDLARVEKLFDTFGYATTAVFTIADTGIGIEENLKNGESTSEIITDAAIDIAGGGWSIWAGKIGVKAGAAVGSFFAPYIGTTAGAIIGGALGVLIGWGLDLVYDKHIDPTLDSMF